MDDLELLRTYARTGSDEAFRQLVHRHAGLVYSAARRQVGDAHAADIAQEAFLKLARQAGRIPPGTPLGPWLYAVARNTAVDFIRREHARRRHGRKLADVGAALGVSEDGAQKRVSRGLDRLEALLSARGIRAGAAALAADLAAHALEAAPAGFAEMVCSGVLSTVKGVTGTAAIKAGGGFFARRWLTAGVISAGLGVAIWQGIILLRQAAEIDGAGRTGPRPRPTPIYCPMRLMPTPRAD